MAELSKSLDLKNFNPFEPSIEDLFMKVRNLVKSGIKIFCSLTFLTVLSVSVYGQTEIQAPSGFTRSDLGRGYDSFSGKLKESPYDPRSIEAVSSSGNPATEYNVTDTSSALDVLNRNSYSLSVRARVALIKFSASLGSTNSKEFSSFRKVFMISVKTRGATVIVLNQSKLKFKDAAIKTLRNSPSDFIRTYGDSVVSKITTGGTAFAKFIIDTKESRIESIFKANLSLSTPKLYLNADLQNELSSRNNERSYSLELSVSGVTELPSISDNDPARTVANLVTYFETFSSKIQGESVSTFLVEDYMSVTGSEIFSNSNAAYILETYEKSIKLNARIGNLSYILENPSDFGPANLIPTDRIREEIRTLQSLRTRLSHYFSELASNSNTPPQTFIFNEEVPNRATNWVKIDPKEGKPGIPIYAPADRPLGVEFLGVWHNAVTFGKDGKTIIDYGSKISASEGGIIINCFGDPNNSNSSIEWKHYTGKQETQIYLKKGYSYAFLVSDNNFSDNSECVNCSGNITLSYRMFYPIYPEIIPQNQIVGPN